MSLVIDITYDRRRGERDSEERGEVEGEAALAVGQFARWPLTCPFARVRDSVGLIIFMRINN